jgi:hypothetical protein
LFQIPHLPYYVLLLMSSLVCYIESVLTMISPPVSVGDVSQHPFILIIIIFLNCAIYSTLRNYVYWYVCIYCRYNHKCFHIKIMHFIYIKKIQSYLSLNKTFTDYLPLMMTNKKFIYFELFQALNCLGNGIILMYLPITSDILSLLRYSLNYFQSYRILLNLFFFSLSRNI